MERFIQQMIRPLASRHVPIALCPTCGNNVVVQKTVGKAAKRKKKADVDGE